MLHRVLLRLSLCFALILSVGFMGLHLYKKDITLFLLSHEINKTLPSTNIEMSDVELSLPFKITLRHLALTQNNNALLKAEKIRVSFNPLTAFGIAPSSGKTLFCFDELSVHGIELFTDHLHLKNNATLQPHTEKLFDAFPRIGIRHFAMDGILNNVHLFEGHGHYFYDASSISFSVGKKEEDKRFQGKITTIKGTDARIHTSIEQYNINISCDLENIWKGRSIPFFLDIEGIPLSLAGSISKQKDAYALLLRYEKREFEKDLHPILNIVEDATLKILWDEKKNHIILEKMDARVILSKIPPDYHPLTLHLEKPVAFDFLEKRLVNDMCFQFMDTSWTLSKVAITDTLKGELKGTITLNKILPKILSDHPFAKELDGHIDVSASIMGSMDNPTVTCRLTPHHVHHRSHNNITVSSTPLTFNYNNQIYTLEGEFLPLKGLKIWTKLSHDTTGEIVDAFLAISGDVSVLKPFLPEKENVGGLFDAKITLKGPLNHLMLSGEGSLKNGLYGNHAVGTHIHPITGNWILKNDKITLSLQGKDDFKGIVTVKGSIFLPWIPDLLKGNAPHFHPIARGRIDLILKEFFIGQSDLFTAKAEGNLFLDLEHMLIGGKLFLAPTVVDLDQLTPSPTPKIALTSDQLKSDVLLGRDPKEDADNTSTQQPSEDSSSTHGLFRFDIEAHPKKPIIVRGFGIESTWDGKLCLKNFAPDFLGEFKIRQGTIDITERILNFTKGKIMFDGKIKNPYLDLEITKKIDGYDVFVRFKGRAKDPRFTFVASPALSEEEVLALILFGRKSSVTSLGQLFDVSSSLSSLSSAGQKKNFFTTFRQTFGIDALELKPQNETSPSKSPQALSIRKRITDDVDLVLEQTFNASEESSKNSKASIEKKIDDQWSIEVDASTDKSGGIGLNWVKRY